MVRRSVQRAGPRPRGPGLCRAGAQPEGCYTIRSSALSPFPLHLASQHDSPIPGVQVLFGKGKTVEYEQGLRGMSCASSECQPLCCLEEPFFTLTEEGEEV